MSRANLHDAGSRPDDLELFPGWSEPFTSRHLFRAAVGSIIVHIVAFAVLLTLPETSGHYTGPPITADFRKTAVPLVAPRLKPKVFEITQKDENQGKVTHELDIRSSLPQAPRKPRSFQPPAPAGPIAPPAALTPPPQSQATVTAPPVAGAAVRTSPAQPSLRSSWKTWPGTPTAPPDNPSIKLPTTALDTLARGAQPGGGGGGMIMSPDGANEATSLRQMQLPSDPSGRGF